MCSSKYVEILIQIWRLQVERKVHSINRAIAINIRTLPPRHPPPPHPPVEDLPFLLAPEDLKKIHSLLWVYPWIIWVWLPLKNISPSRAVIKRQGARNIMNEAPTYFQRKIEEKLNWKKPLAVSLLTTCCIYPATWNPRENSLAVYPWRILVYPEEFCGNWNSTPKEFHPFFTLPPKEILNFYSYNLP